MAEGIESLRVLFERPRSTYEGKYRRFVDVESDPKPVQTPLPIFSGGNGTGALQRAGERCEGWLPAKIGPAEIAAGRATVATYACAAGRDPTVTSRWVAISRGREPWPTGVVQWSHRRFRAYCEVVETSTRRRLATGEPGETWATRTAARSAGCFAG